MTSIDVNALREPYEDVRNDNSDTKWALWTYDDSGKTLIDAAKGTGDVEELKEHLDDGKIMYGFLRVISGDEESKRAKFVFITFVGESVGVLKKARVSVHKKDVRTIIASIAVEYHVSSKAELAADKIALDVKNAGGANYSRV